MNTIEVNPIEKTAVIQRGATGMEVIRAAEPNRLLAAVNSTPCVSYAEAEDQLP